MIIAGIFIGIFLMALMLTGVITIKSYLENKRDEEAAEDDIFAEMLAYKIAGWLKQIYDEKK